MYKTLQDFVGNTPLVRLVRIPGADNDRRGNVILAKLEGNNPALYEGQAVRFNINVEQNLDPLLQSLRIGDKLEQRIEDGMQ